MTRTALSLQVDDLSQFARSLHKQLVDQTETPGHLALMNMLARAAGWKNHQHLRASTNAAVRLAGPADPPVDLKKIEGILRHFDAEGRLIRWPARTSVQRPCVWALWSRLPMGQTMTEQGISAILNQWHLFSDAAILRRTLVELGLVTRIPGGRDYHRCERKPDPDVVALIRLLHARAD
jgi:hypothetical protein